MAIRQRFPNRKPRPEPKISWPETWTDEELAIWLDMQATLLQNRKPSYFKTPLPSGVSTMAALLIQTEYRAYREAAKRLRTPPATATPADQS